MRAIALLTVSMLHAVAATAGPDSATAQGKRNCESQAPGYDSQGITCSLNPSGATRRFRFKANFSGSHDDTTASMEATLDGAPLTCEKGSKTNLQGEDGEVSLECRFAIVEKADTKHLLGVTLSWRHAQYKDFELDSD